MKLIKTLSITLVLLFSSLSICLAASTEELVKAYYDSLNKKDIKQFFALMDSNVIHDINQGTTEIGIEKFKKFMEKSNASFDEKLTDIVIMVSNDGKHAAALWVDHGTYYHDYPGMDLKAHNQQYVIKGGHFFEIRQGGIYRVTTYFNENDFMKQIRK
jgi:steroid delta-isomerase-like uncharacterized protein